MISHPFGDPEPFGMFLIALYQESLSEGQRRVKSCMVTMPESVSHCFNFSSSFVGQIGGGSGVIQKVRP